MLLINVTEFFRDQPAWDHLRDGRAARAARGQAPDAPVRVWSAGCAGGQEAYTIAMVLAEALGEEAYRERVKIYATDIDEDALSQARYAVYSAKETESVPAELRERYFERADQRLAFRKDLRRTVIFGRNNLVSDAPISRLDLLICRNTLMYFNAETQARILRHFHFALNDDGVLMLGRSEMMLSHRDLFSAVDLKQRLFAKRPRDALQSRVAGPANGEAARLRDGEESRREPRRGAGAGAARAGHRLARRRAHVRQPAGPRAVPHLARRHRAAAREPPAGPAAGRARAADRAGRCATATRWPLGEVEFTPDRGETRRLDITVAPLLRADNTPLGAAVTFEDTTRSAALQSELETNRRDLELAYEELQSTIDELETTNEELQSANEELQTTNEELQSTNEELETMNEELQSTNEELETINDELRERTGELNEVNDFLEAILTSLGLGVAVLDAQQRVQIWNNRAEDLWGLRRDEAVDHHFLSLDIGLPSEQLAAPLRTVLGGASERERRELAGGQPPRPGDPLRRHGAAAARPGRGERRAVRGAIVMMEDRPTSDTDGHRDDRGATTTSTRAARRR